MNSHTRRGVVAGAAAATATAIWPASARASAPAAIAQDPGYRAWTAPQGAGGLPLQVSVDTADGARSLRQWIGGRPAVLALWATWCTPCLLEKPHQADLAARLARAGAATRIFALQAYDEEDVGLSDARWMLDRIGANQLPLARASAGAEQAFRQLFGLRDHSRATLPIVFLIGGDGLELGRSTGIMRGVDGHTDYWEDEATFRFLSRLV